MREYLPTLILIAAVLVVSILLLKLLTKALRAHEKKNGPQIHLTFAYTVARLFVILLAVATIGSQFSGFSQTVSAILASSGIVALAISLAAQESLSNIIDGLFISLFKPFNIGDRVTLPEKNNLTGLVRAINLRHTVITTFNNSSFIIPNSVMSTAIVENSDYDNETFTYPIDVTVAYNCDLEKAMRILVEVVTSHPAYVDRRTPADIEEGKPMATAMARNFGASGIDIRCGMVTKDVAGSFAACSEVRVALKKRYDEEGIVIPYQTIHIDNLPNKTESV